MSVKSMMVYVYTGKVEEAKENKYVCVKCNCKVKAQTSAPSYRVDSERCPLGGTHRWKKV